MERDRMTRKRYDQLTRAGRARVTTGALLRAAATVALLLCGYFLAPLDRPLDAGTLVKFLLGLVLVGAIVAWQARRILTSHVPRLQAIQAIAVILPLLLLVFAAIYVAIETNRPGSFTEPLSRIDSLYFTVTVFSTVGFGDITPVSEAARLVAVAQMILDLVVLGLGVRLILSAVQRGRAARAAAEVGSGEDGEGTAG
jgi:voltage-gated potassium channel